MVKLNLSLACTRYDRTEAILEGLLKANGIDFFTISAARPGEIFWRMLLFEEFDCSEMSLSSFSIVKSTGRRDWVGIPAFTARHFFHTDVLVNVDARIKEPADLEGKRVGLPEYQQTAAVWARGVLRDEFDIRPERIHWCMGRSRGRSREKVTGIEAPSNIDLKHLEGITLGEALTRGELDALLVYSPTPSLVDALNPDLTGHSKVRTLFEDPEAEAIRYYRKTGVFPINHMIVLKKTVDDNYPWAATEIFKAFKESKRKAYEKWCKLESWESFPSQIFLSNVLRRQRAIFGDDPFPYGFARSEKTLKTLARYLHEQGLTSGEMDPTSIFAETTLHI